MSDYLLDTHTAIWFFTGDTKLSTAAKQIIRDKTNRIFLNMISTWELSIKTNIGKLNFPGNTKGFMQAVKANNITVIPIKTEHCNIYETLPLLHRDPFDRMLIAAALSEDMILVTDDKNIALYDVPQIW